MNMILNHAEKDCRLEIGDAITEPGFILNQMTHDQFDIAVANPPANATDWDIAMLGMIL